MHYVLVHILSSLCCQLSCHSLCFVAFSNPKPNQFKTLYEAFSLCRVCIISIKWQIQMQFNMILYSFFVVIFFVPPSWKKYLLIELFKMSSVVTFRHRQHHVQVRQLWDTEGILAGISSPPTLWSLNHLRVYQYLFNKNIGWH